MMLVWVVIPLVLVVSIIGIVGVQESFAEELVISVIGKDVDFLDFEVDEDTASLILFIDAKKNGISTITIPKDIWYIADNSCRAERPFVLIDGEEVKLGTDFVSYTTTSSVFKIDLPENAKEIEFISTYGGPPTAFDFGKQCWEPQKLRLMSPAKQISNGIQPDSVNCKSELKLIFKPNFSPACVTPETFLKLFERGWTAYAKINVKIYTDKPEYKLGEEIKITMKNEGKSDVFFDFKIGFSISDENGHTVQSFGPGNFYLDAPKYDVKFSPLDTYNATWSQKDSRSKDAYVLPGTYTIKTNFVDIEKNSYTASTQFDIIILDEYYELREKTDPEFISYFDKADIVFVGKITSKISGDVVPEFFWLKFDVDEYFKYFPASGKPSDLPLNLNITTNEGSWQNCILTEGKTYLIFAVDEYDLRYTRDQHCFWAVETPHTIVDELRKISTVLYG